MNGHQLADIGIEQARAHAHAAVPDWTDRILECLDVWASEQTRPFAMEDFREWVIYNRIDLIPPSHQAWGALGRTAINRRVIKHMGYRPARSALTRGHPVRVFVRAV